MITFGVFSLLLGFVLLALGIIRLFVSRSQRSSWRMPASLAAIGLILVISGFSLLEAGKGQGGGVVTIGSLLTIVGFLVMLAATWFSFWGPVRTGLTGTSLKFFLLGIAVFVLGVAIIVFPFGWFGEDISYRLQVPYSMQGLSVGPLPFPAFILFVFLLGNGLGFKNRLRTGQMIGANLVFLALVIAVYFAISSSRF